MSRPDAKPNRYERYLAWRSVLDDPYLELDLGYAGLTDADLASVAPDLTRALEAMAELEAGAIANPDENRRVGHYWLRAPGLAPSAEISTAIEACLGSIRTFADSVHHGAIRPPKGAAFRRILWIGIGGSALGPMLLADALGDHRAPMRLWAMDNTDPAGIDRLVAELGDLRDVLFVVASKSGGTPETRNGMAEAARACAARNLQFVRQAVAVTGEDSALARRAQDEGWLATFPMWDWVGGRTSVTSAVGLLPLALLGHDVRGFLAGAAAMDGKTRNSDLRDNPAALLAAFWHQQGDGHGARDAVILPYKDSLSLLARYLQQLVMESLGKELDRAGRVVFQGLSVFGNKGSTDQHAYVQQLRDGLHNFFVTFVRVLTDRRGPDCEVEDGVTSGDYLDGYWQGTRAALDERGRGSATITLRDVDERSLGALIALFERAVGIYAELIDVNAYHQPGVEAGKRAAATVLELQRRLSGALGSKERSAGELAAALGADAEQVWQVLRHLAHNRADVTMVDGNEPERARFVRARRL